MRELFRSRRLTHPFPQDAEIYDPAVFCCSVPECKSVAAGAPTTKLLGTLDLATSTMPMPTHWRARVVTGGVVLLCEQHHDASPDRFRPCGGFICSLCSRMMSGDIGSRLLIFFSGLSRGAPQRSELEIFQRIPQGWGCAMAVVPTTHEPIASILLCPEHTDELQAHQEALGTA